MKIINLVAVAALGLSATAAMAQTGNGSDVSGGTISSTVSGVFVPTTTGTTIAVGTTISAPPATPINVPPVPGPAAPGIIAVTAGTPAAVATFTHTLTTSGLPPAAAQGFATALQQLGGGGTPTVGSLTAAVATWNATIATLSPVQVQALLSTPQGIAACRAIAWAYIAAGHIR